MALQHLRSSTAHKRPIPTAMSAGQIAVNTNEGSPGLFFKDSNGDLVKVGPVHIGTTAPNSSPDSVAATALVTGTVYQILTVGNSDFTLVGASANTVGTVFTATGTTTGTGTVSGQQGNEKGEQWLDTTGSAFDLKIYDGTAWRSQAGEFVNVTGDTMTGAFGVVAGTASAPGVFFSGDTNTGLLSPGADSVALTTGGTQRVVVDSSGNVGIGATPEEILHIAAASETVDSRDGVMLQSTSSLAADTGLPIVFTSHVGSVANYGVAAIAGRKENATSGNAAGYLQFATGNSAGAVSEKMRIDSSGNVGIGTASPYTVSAAGNNLNIANTSSSAEINFLSSTTGFNALYFGDGSSGSDRYRGYLEYAHNGDYMRFATATVERMRINSSGNVGIGTTSPTSSLEVHSSGGSNIIAKSTNGNGGFLNYTGLASNGTTTFSVNHNGSGYFASDITVAGDPASGANIGAKMYSTGAFIATKASGGTLWAGFAQGNSTATSLIKSDGSVTLESFITAKGVGTFGSLTSPNAVDAIVDQNGHEAIRVFCDDVSGNKQSVSILGNGSAQFAGTVGTGAASSSAISGAGARIRNTGDISIRKDGSVASVFEVFKDGDGAANKTAVISNDGAATFSFTAANGGLSTYGVSVLGRSTSSNYNFFGNKILNGVETNTSYIRGDGVAVFAGSVTAQGSVLTSDQRFKENIADAKPQLADITALGNKLRNWDWTDDAPVVDKDIRFLGLVAQEVETICPGIVTTVARTKDGAELTPEVVVPAVYETRTVPAVLDDEGNVVEAETTEQVLVTEKQVTPATYEQLDDSYKGIKNDILIMKLLGAVAELSAKVEALEAG